MDTLLLILLFIVALWLPLSAVAAEAPPLMLAKIYQPGTDVFDYYVSEKLDGVRAYWDGRQLLSRSGRVIRAPAWFTGTLPARPLDGELWMGRGRFSQLSGILNRRHPKDGDWRDIRYMLFDLPDVDAPFSERLWVLKTLVAQHTKAPIAVVEQIRMNSDQQLMDHLQEITAAGGEGLMLHHVHSRYQANRSSQLLKLKEHQDDEAKVIGYVPGKGKYEGALGALIVKMDDGREFRLGSGLSDAERNHPPQIGSSVTFAYNGLTSNGLPRFARFIRVRPQE